MHTIQLSDNDIAVIFEALGEGKLRICGPVFTNIQQQLATPPLPMAPIENADTNAA
jgi:hypothetical protein